MRLTWLADVLRAAGLTVHEHDGWQSRGKELRAVEAIVCHHTASGPRTSDAANVRILTHGRSDLPGPLAQLGLRRDGSFDVIAAGKCNHNGYGTHGNQTIGIEAYNDGVGEPWPKVQADAYQRACAAIADRLSLPTSRVLGHKETDPKRKIDPAGIDMDGFRAGVAALRANPNAGPPAPPSEEDTFMAGLTEQQQVEMYGWLKRLVGDKDKDGKTWADRIGEHTNATRAAVGRIEKKV